MEYCLLEAWDNSLSLPKDCVYVALTIEASYHLDKCGIKHITFEDFYSKGEICSDADIYLDLQLEWLKEFDDFVQNIYPKAKELKLCLPSLYFFNIQMLVDQIVLSSRIIKRFIDSTKPSKIWFITQVFYDDEITRWSWFRYGETLFSRLINPLCKEKGIPVEKIILKQNQEHNFDIGHTKIFLENIPPKQKIVKLSKKVLPSRVKVLVRAARQLYLQAKCFCIWPFGRKHNKGNLLIIKGRDYVYDFAKDANYYGFNLLFKNGKYIRKQLFWIPWGKKSRPIRNHEEATLREDLNPDVVINDICNGKIMNWINEECGFNVASIVASRFGYLILDLFPKTISLIQDFDELYTELEIDYVINYSLYSEDDFAATAAARINNSTKSIGFYHGMSAYDSRQRYFRENCNFDLYFASTGGEVENISNWSKSLGYSHPIVNEYPYLRNRVKRVSGKKRSNKRFSINKFPIVLYVPIIRKIRPYPVCIDKTLSPMMSYLKWHNSIIAYFSSRKDFHFVWKAAAWQPFEYDTIPNILEDKECTNISYSTTELLEWFPKVDRVMCDIPSTSFFEACFAELPVMALYNPMDSILRENGYDCFGNSLRPYSSTDEGIKIVEEFLDGDPGDYIVSLEERDTSVIDVLNSFL